MVTNHRRKTKIWLIIAGALFVLSCIMLNFKREDLTASGVFCVESTHRDLEHILTDGKLVAMIDFSPTSYFVYKGIPMGFHYDLLKDLTESLELELDVRVENDIEMMIKMLLAGEVDIIAMDMTVIMKRRQQLAFLHPHIVTRQVLVQRLPDGYNSMNRRQIERHLVRNLLDLKDKEIYIPANSSYLSRLEHIQEEIGGKIHIVSSASLGVDQLIEMVSRGDIQFTVCDEHLARVELNYYNNLDIETALSFDQEMAWAVRPASTDLFDAVLLWQKKYFASARYAFLFRKYFHSSRSYYLRQAEFNSVKGGSISEYDDLIRKYSEIIDWDWRLLASLIYQESRFKHELTSWAGAWGLMQLMPQTSMRFVADSFASPEDNIRAGVKFIRWMDNYLPDTIEAEERQKFILAGYNIGLGHVMDARRLAKKFGKNPNLWEENTAFYLELKSRPQYYLDPVVKSGFCRGKAAVDFVSEVLNRYNHYKNVVPD